MREILQDFSEKIKRILRDDQIYTIVLIVIVGCASFALGVLSVKDSTAREGVITIQATSMTEKKSILLEEKGREQASSKVMPIATGAFVGSKGGRVYYPATCSSASRIKEENKIFFATVAEAEGAGRTRSSQCR